MKRHGVESMKALTAQLLDDAATSEELVLPDGRRARIRRRPSPGVRAVAELVDATPEGVQTFSLFEEAERRAETYPAGLPFVPNVAATLATSAALYMVAWEAGDHVDAVYEAVVEQLRAHDWQDLTAMVPLPLPTRFTSLERAGEKSSLVGVAGTVMLMVPRESV